MRSYGKNWIYKKTASYKERQERAATEWDVRLDVGEGLLAEDIVNNVKQNKDRFLYVFVSGVEEPDEKLPDDHPKEWANRSKTRSTQEHIHLCIILLEPSTRTAVLQLLRGRRKILDEYCTPRNAKFTYAGWVIHHSKEQTKILKEPSSRLEIGTLPVDPYTIDVAIKINNILKKWGDNKSKERFSSYTDMLKKYKIKEKIEQLQMTLEDHDIPYVA